MYLLPMTGFIHQSLISFLLFLFGYVFCMYAFQRKLQPLLHSPLNDSTRILLNRVQYLFAGAFFQCQIYIQWNARIINVSCYVTQTFIKYITINPRNFFLVSFPSESTTMLIFLCHGLVLPVLKLHISEILHFSINVYYKASFTSQATGWFSYWFVMLHVSVVYSFLLLTSLPLYKYTSLFIYSPTDGHLSSFHFRDNEKGCYEHSWKSLFVNIHFVNTISPE